MKYFIALIFIAFLICGCSKEEVKLEAFSPESFAFDIGDTWEVNALVNVRGFVQKEEVGTYSASIQYTVNMITPDGKTITNVFEDAKVVNEEEEIADIPLEVQFELDSTYTAGKYKLLFNIRDNFSEKSTEVTIEFEPTE
ncbi:MAG: hypothetical protein DRQ13_02890 [Ignavibacteriae bacterium]|nr:MAG: hypothetical protein DRQ13_02890 [Ignavibacteriota bacterium]